MQPPRHGEYTQPPEPGPHRHYHPQSGHEHQPPEKSRAGLYTLIGAGGVLVILAIVAAFVLGKSSDSPSSNSSSAAPAAGAPSAAKTSAAPPGLNTEVRDAGQAFVVNDVTCGKATVGNSYSSKTAKGQYCLATMKVTNVGQTPTYVLSTAQQLHVGGAQYAADSEATVANESDEESTNLSPLNPGASKTVPIVFDIPKGQTPTGLTLHGALGSTGVDITVS